MDGTLFRREERTVFALRELYDRFGYRQYRMRKFEEYSLYARNRDFLVSDRVLTFTDTDGRLLALKPDVTLSIVRNTRDAPGKQKLFYDETVYRVTGSSGGYREIRQTGLECIGDPDAYTQAEVLMLAAQSMRCVAEGSLLVLSHLDILTALTDRLEAGLRSRALALFGSRNLHELRSLCAQSPDGAKIADRLEALADCCGTPAEVLPALEALEADPKALAELRTLTDCLAVFGLADMLRLDFCQVGDVSYYNGIVFKGYAPGLPAPVLSGGRYDRLMERMGRRTGALGFAVYLNELERLPEDPVSAPDRILDWADAASPVELCRLAAEAADRGERILVT